MKKKILIIAAHPDDEVLGCGATMAKLIADGNRVYVLVLGEGATSRDQKRERAIRAKEICTLKRQMRESCNVLGIKDIFAYDLPDNRFDELSLLDVVKIIESVKKKVRPDAVYTHYSGDLNVDHRITYNAVLTACRPLVSETVKEIYSFEIPSSTEWNYPRRFNPNCFVDVTHTIGHKLSALKRYRSELRKYPHPRSLEGVKLNAAYWGMRTGVRYAEAFECVRVVK